MGNPLSYKEMYIRNLPHIQPPGATFFITYRLVGSLPVSVIKQLNEEYYQIENSITCNDAVEVKNQRANKRRLEFFGRWDSELDNSKYGPHWLSLPEIGRIIRDSLHHHNSRLYDIDTFCILSNHVHVIFTPLMTKARVYTSLAKIMHALKSYTANTANRILDRKGQFWQHESYDHVIRNEEELLHYRSYVLNNPVNAKLVDSAERWPWSYCKYLQDSA